MNTRTEKIETIQKNIVLALGALLAFFLAFYAFSISGAIRNVVAREKLASDTSSIRASIAESEQQYVSLKDSVTADLAAKLGFVPASQPIFVSTAQSGGAALSVNIR